MLDYFSHATKVARRVISLNERYELLDIANGKSYSLLPRPLHRSFNQPVNQPSWLARQSQHVNTLILTLNLSEIRFFFNLFPRFSSFGECL